MWCLLIRVWKAVIHCNLEKSSGQVGKWKWTAFKILLSQNVLSFFFFELWGIDRFVVRIIWMILGGKLKESELHYGNPNNYCVCLGTFGWISVEYFLKLVHRKLYVECRLQSEGAGEVCGESEFVDFWFVVLAHQIFSPVALLSR